MPGRRPPVYLIGPAAGYNPRPADPLPEPLLSAETGALTELGSCTEISELPLADPV
jgi:hypothetical protein